MKDKKPQRLGQRAPMQDRARHKVELMLEAAIRLLDSGGMDALTTNAVAATAGVSIGTLYQYFPNKAAILDALAERDGAVMSESVLMAMRDPAPADPRDRVALIVHAVTTGFGERRRAQRIVMRHSLSSGMQRLAPLFETLIDLLVAGDSPGEHEPHASITPAEAFVLTHAVAGVLRAMITADAGAVPPRDEIEAGLARLIEGFARAG